MRLIAELTDRVILGQDGMSDKPPRCTARAVVRRTDGLYAVMYSIKFNLYSLPGGGIEDGEDALSALAREIREETGCHLLSTREIGTVSENRASLYYTQVSYYYEATVSPCGSTSLTESEKASGTVVLWRPLREVRCLITSPRHTTVQRRYLQARDAAALEAYSHLINEHESE